MLDHMLDLPLHGEEEQGQEIEQQDGPEDRDVEERDEGQKQRQQHRPSTKQEKLLSKLDVLTNNSRF